MMLAIRISLSGPNTAEARAKYFEDHKAYLRSGRITVLHSGPIDDGDGGMTGGVVIAEVGSLEAMHEFNAGDPFVINGVYDRVSIYRWKPTIGGTL